ncbi:MAG: hypothetical protein PHI48_04120 [Bacteroidales bacterium]|nr:hypothetical protein [Bacteroidales bacterium]
MELIRSGGVSRISMYNDDKEIEVIDNFQRENLWNRARVTDRDFTTKFYYSLDGIS